MNQFLKQLSSKPTAQQCLVKYLEHLQEYFEKTPANLSEDKTNLRINKICEKIQGHLQNIHSLSNITHKIIANVRVKIDDKFDQGGLEDPSDEPKDEVLDLGTLISVTACQSNPASRWDQPLNRKVNEKWIRDLLVEEIKSLKEDLRLDETVVLEELQRIFTKGCKVLFFDSYLSNIKIMEKLAETGVDVVVVTIASQEDKEGEGTKGKNNSNKLEYIDLTEAGTYVCKCQGVVLSADSILLNGGILSGSGALMIAAAAKKQRVPIMALGRGFSLCEKSLIQQKGLLENENPLEYFPFTESSARKVLIGKRHDYIESGLLTRIVCELGEVVPSGVHNHYKQYYFY